MMRRTSWQNANTAHLVPVSFQAHPAAQSFHGSFDPEAYRTGLKADFEVNAIHLIQNAVPQAAQ